MKSPALRKIHNPPENWILLQLQLLTPSPEPPSITKEDVNEKPSLGIDRESTRELNWKWFQLFRLPFCWPCAYYCSAGWLNQEPGWNTFQSGDKICRGITSTSSSKIPYWTPLPRRIHMKGTAWRGSPEPASSAPLTPPAEPVVIDTVHSKVKVNHCAVALYWRYGNRDRLIILLHSINNFKCQKWNSRGHVSNCLNLLTVWT